MRTVALILILFFARTTFAAVFINEVQISPINDRFIELYNSDNFDVDLTGWYLQRKTATGSSFGSLVTSTQLNGKTIKAQGYFLISRSQLYNSDVVTDITLTESNTIRIRDSKGKDVDQIEWGSIDEGKSYQKTSGAGWVASVPTPRAANNEGVGASPQNTNNTPVSTPASNAPASTTATPPQVSVKATSQVRVVLAGEAVLFEGKISNLENSATGATRIEWTFGDGVSAQGETVSHTYYYPGEYTAVIDIVSGNLVATDKMLVRVVLPNITLHTGGDTSRSFITIENNGGEELDISGWQVASENKIFTFPKNTILAARRSVTFASEVTGLLTPTGSTPELRFPNGTLVETKNNTTSVVPSFVTDGKQVSKLISLKSASPKVIPRQEALILDSASDTKAPIQSKQKENGLWPWYIGAAFLCALALIGIRLTQKSEEKTTITADDFEIIEETDNEEPH